jgi:hypothetical protein
VHHVPDRSSEINRFHLMPGLVSLESLSSKSLSSEGRTITHLLSFSIFIIIPTSFVSWKRPLKNTLKNTFEEKIMTQWWRIDHSSAESPQVKSCQRLQLPPSYLCPISPLMLHLDSDAALGLWCLTETPWDNNHMLIYTFEILEGIIMEILLVEFIAHPHIHSSHVYYFSIFLYFDILILFTILFTIRQGIIAVSFLY